MRLAAKVTAGVLLLDQVSKYIVVQGMHLDQRGAIDVVPPYLNFRMAWNRGVNFGLFSGETDWMRWVLIVVALVISLWVWVWIAREPHSRRVNISAGLLVGGALGNVVDRLVYGAVADFLNMSLPGWQNPYSFNVADVAIFLGAVGLVLFTGKDHRANDG
ncbi:MULTISPECIES: signal peptidase II [Thioclava]|uniref:signal peptidase II n=1 Tax=Thioclava TaxID=285107 RepID=UPI000C3707E9|nr:MULTISPECIES: signal peptidase II [Thioclava]MAQ36446.1 signal peptidase II [Thioclava sp.]MPQ95603.1 signal peptidase II [Thioclava sp. JE_KL1]